MILFFDLAGKLSTKCYFMYSDVQWNLFDKYMYIHSTYDSPDHVNKIVESKYAGTEFWTIVKRNSTNEIISE